MRRALLSLLVALCAAALLPHSALGATYELSLSNPTELPVGFSAFTGASFGVTITNPLAVARPDELYLVAKCDPAFSVAPAARCLAASEVSFSVTVVGTQAGAVANPCKFSLVGDKAATDLYGVDQLNAAPQLAAWTVKLTETLKWEERLAMASPSNPMRVHDEGTYSFNFSRSSGSMEVIDACTFVPKCNDEMVSSSSSGEVFVGATAATVTLRFNNQARSNNYAMCTFDVQCNNVADQFRYALPSVYFRVGLASELKTPILVSAPAGGFVTSSTANTTSVLSVSLAPVLQWYEWLAVSVVSCSSSTAGQGEQVTRGFGAESAVDSAVKRWGMFASTNAGPAIILPPFVNGAMFATCTLALDGSSEALLRYTLATSVVTIDIGRTVTLTPTFDSSIWTQSTPIVVADINGNTPRVRFVPDQSTIIGDLYVSIACGECDGTNGPSGTGYVSGTGVVTADDVVVTSSSSTIDFPSRPYTTNVTASPWFDFTASTFDYQQSSVLQSCYYTLSGADSKYFQLSSASTTFRLIRPRALAMTANNGVVSPLFTTSAETGFSYFNGYTVAAIPASRARDTVVTVDVPVGFELQVGFNCTLAGVDTAVVSAEGGAAVSTINDGSQDYTSVGFLRDTPASAVARFSLPTTVIDQPTPGQLVYCQIKTFGRDAAQFVAPSALSFHVGTPVQLSVQVNTASEGDRAFRTSNSDSVDDVNKVFFNISAPAGSDATVYNTAPRLSVTCTSDVIDTNAGGSTPVYKSVTVYNVDTQSPTSTITLAVGVIEARRRFYVRLSDTAARTIRCAYSFTQSETRDQRRFLAPTATVVSVRPQALVTPSGSIVPAANADAIQTNLFARVAPGSSNTLTLSSNESPLSGEAVDVTINCGTDITPLPVVRTVTSAARAPTWTFEAPSITVVPAGTGRLYTCELALNSTAPGGKWSLSLTSFNFVVGDVATWSASASEVSLYTSTTSAAVSFTPSACRTDLTLSWQCTVIKPETGKAVSFEDYDGSWSRSRSGDVYSLTVTAPSGSVGPSTGAYDVTCRVSSMSYSYSATGFARPFDTPRNVVFRVQPRATFQFVGLNDVAADVNQIQFAVRPTAAPAPNGVQVEVQCRFYNDANQRSVSNIYLFWFAGSTEAQTISLSRTSNSNGYGCQINVDPQSELSADSVHYEGVSEVLRRIGSPAAFAVTVTSNYFAATRCSKGTAQLSMRPVARLGKSTTVELLCARVENFNPDGSLKSLGQRMSPDVSVFLNNPGWSSACSSPSMSSSCSLSFGTDCDEEPQSFWLTNGNGAGSDVYTGEVRCTYSAPAQRFTAAAPANTRALYTGVTPPPASSDDDGLSGGAIAGIVIGVIVGVALLAALVYVVKAKKSKSAAGVQQVAPEFKAQPAVAPAAPAASPASPSADGQAAYVEAPADNGTAAAADSA